MWPSQPRPCIEHEPWYGLNVLLVPRPFHQPVKLRPDAVTLRREQGKGDRASVRAGAAEPCTLLAGKEGREEVREGRTSSRRRLPRSRSHRLCGRLGSASARGRLQ